jgi:endogenous inhibitor of DNA gyrase (YacG/DUF329 family)
MIARCPTCRVQSRRDGNTLWPFCSTRCHLVDLGRWLSEDYRVPSDDDAPPPPPREPDGE